MNKTRFGRIAIVLTIAAILLVLQPVRPAQAWVASYASYNGGSFIRIPDGQPIMTIQQNCVSCVASGTQAWIDYARLTQGTNSRPTQDSLWTYFGTAHGAWGAPYDTAWETRCPSVPYGYNRRAANVSLDDGVDPYGAAWAMWDNTPAGYYYHINVYSTGTTTSGYDYASHGVAWTLANYQEPVGVVIGNGGHFVLITYVETDVSPLSNFWATINMFRYRDPFLSPGAYPYNDNRVDSYFTSTDWGTKYTEYGYSGHSFVAAPNCDVSDPNSINANCRDEARRGTWANNLWWGRWVTIERDQTWQNNPDWAWRRSQ